MRSLLLISLLAWPALADPPQIRLPKLTATTPKTEPPPGVPMVLTKELVYVVDSDVPLLITTSPVGMVKQTKEESPFTIKTWFADSPTVFERRTFKGKFVVSLEPTIDGEYELLVMPAMKMMADKDGKLVPAPILEADILRRAMKNGTAPRPPPGPTPVPPGPTPTPQPVTSFRVIFAFESATVTPAQSNIMYGKQVEDFLMANTTPEGGIAGFRRTDKDINAANDQPTIAALWAAVKPQLTTIPCMIVEVNGKATILPFPTSPADCLATLKQYRGIK